MGAAEDADGDEEEKESQDVGKLLSPGDFCCHRFMLQYCHCFKSLLIGGGAGHR